MLVGGGEVLAEVVAGARLQRLAVAHQRLDGVGAQRARELLALGLAARSTTGMASISSEKLR